MTPCILFNGSTLLGPRTGIAHYVHTLAGALAQDPSFDFRFYNGWRFAPQAVAAPHGESSRWLRMLYTSCARFVPHARHLRRRCETPLFALQAKRFSPHALYHEPGFAALPYAGPMVMTVYDLSCFDHPDMHPAERVRLVEQHMPASLARAERIIVISEATGRALHTRFNIPTERIRRTYLAADACFHPRSAAAVAPVIAGFSLQAGAYVLSVGTLEPRKNLPALFAAYAGLPATLRRQFPLVVAGMKGWQENAALRFAAPLLQKGELRLLGYVSDDILPFLYAGAAAFVYPSRYEGFGLPPLEAMAAGIPVITSNQTSLPEIVGDAGVMVDPDDVDGLRENLRQLLENRTYASDLGQRGLLRSRLFSWSRCISETKSVYEEILRDHKTP